ncbi:TRAP transporter large permease [Enemella sp. A6]|uniref:TRAP transporter large permease n=1 Tax=Enemella sp. A6 TaxID=3440152 RepID=UPI003EB78ACF
MEWWLTLAIFVGGLFILLLARVPVAFALFGLTAAAATFYYGFKPAGRIMMLSAYETLTSFVLAPIALFILMGDIVFRTGVASRSLAGIRDLFPRQVPARTGLLTSVTGALFGMMSGSTLANTALLGKTFLPDMLREGYKPQLAMGTVTAGGGLAMIIPPSTLAIVWAATANVPVGPLLVAGIIPGIVMMVGYILVTLIWGGPLKGAGSGHGAHEAEAGKTLAKRLIVGLREALPLAVIVFLVLGMIFLGVATPTESAALGVLGAFVLALAYRKLSWSVIKESTIESAKVSAMLYFIMASSSAYSQVMSFSGATSGFIDFVTGMVLHPAVLLILIQLILLFLGAFLEQVSIMLITLPLLMPVVNAMGWDPIWFGILMLINLRIALVTPPFGMELFVMKGVAGAGVRMREVYAGVAPFVLSDVAVMVLIALVPGIALALPGLMGG